MASTQPSRAAAVPPPRALGAPSAFFAAIRPTFGGSLGALQVTGIIAKLTAFSAAGCPLSWVAYGLATSFWETSRTMQPVEEVGHGRGCAYGAPGCHAGQVAYGRGDVQLTWDRNYERADHELGLRGALIADYALALRPNISAQIMIRGMVEGWFTGRCFADYLPRSGAASSAQFIAARRIINGEDHAAAIELVATAFQAALIAGCWS